MKRNKIKIIKWIVVFVFLMIVHLNIVLGEIQTLGTFKQNECVSLIQTCADCTYINFTRVMYPNSTSAMGEVAATKQGTVFNYTFCNTTVIGEYIVDGFGDVSGTDTVFNYDFKITYYGKAESDGSSFGGIIIGIILIGVTIIFGAFAITFRESRAWQIAFILLTLFMVIIDFRFAAIALESATTSALDTTLQSNMVGNLNQMYWIFLNIFRVVIFLAVVYVFIRIIKSFDKRKRAEMMREAKDNEMIFPR